MRRKFEWYEFFAGGGMARIGLGPRWKCTFANDCCPKKVASYRAHFGRSPELKFAKVEDLRTDDLPGRPTLVWASFPCQDLSLAGNGAGLDGHRSGTFKPFWTLVELLVKERRKPKLIVLENVEGAITSHGGSDFEAIIRMISDQKYRVGAMVMDAVHFLPQSRPRLFILALDSKMAVPKRLVSPAPDPMWHPQSLVAAQAALSDSLRDCWIWWRLPHPRSRVAPLSSLIEEQPTGTTWHSLEQTKHILSLMSDVNLRKLSEAQAAKKRMIGTVYRRTRPVEINGVLVKRQRAEVRFDNISGCLRTPVGGSSRQTVLVVEGKRIRSRLLSPREAARLMGVPEDYPLPRKYNEGYHLFGDGLAVPVVSWLNQHLLLELLHENPLRKACINAQAHSHAVSSGSV